MPYLTTGEGIISALLSLGSIGFAGWLRNIGTRCGGVDKRLQALEILVTQKSGLVDKHEDNLDAGTKEMDAMKAELTNLSNGINDLRLLGMETSGKIDGLGQKIKTEVNEILLKIGPRLKQAEGHIDCHKKKIRELQDKTA